MDIYCPTCGEPWDHDTLREVAEESGLTYTTVARSFRARGCRALGSRCAHTLLPADSETAAIIAAAYELNGDDMDGAACDLEDLLRW